MRLIPQWYKSKTFKENNPWRVRVVKISKAILLSLGEYMQLPFIMLRNYILVKRFPFLKPSCGWDVGMNYYPKDYKYRYEETWLDGLPDGWRKAFGIQLCKELRKAINDNNLKDYAVHQVKEKFGFLRWYDEGGNKNTHEIIEKYEDLSEQICFYCGKPAKYVTKGWITYVCEKCAKNKYNPDHITPIKDFEEV